MRKLTVNLIKFHTEGDDAAFIEEAYKAAVEFNRAGDYEFGDYILALLSDKNILVPQMHQE